MDGVPLAEARTTATITLLGAGLVVLVLVSRPIQVWKIALAASMAAMYTVVLSVGWLRDYFQLDLPTTDGWIVTAIGTAIAGFGVWLAPAAVAKLIPDD
ncbi:MAG: cation-transporting ATPase E [Ilumatobacter sp.]|jgi:cation-transporting ATPase E